LQEADVLLHVVDASHEDAAKQSAAVFEVLQDLGVEDDIALVTVWNKVDACADPDATRAAAAAQPGTLLVSAQEGEGLPELLVAVEAALEESMVPFEALIPYTEGWAMGLLRERGIVRKEEYTEEGVSILASANPDVVGQVRDFVVEYVPGDRIFAWRRASSSVATQMHANGASTEEWNGSGIAADVSSEANGSVLPGQPVVAHRDGRGADMIDVDVLPAVELRPQVVAQDPPSNHVNK
jgi:hypothetical protein